MTNISTTSNETPQMVQIPTAEPLVNTNSRAFPLITYGLYAVGLFIPFLSIIGVILAYVKRGDASGTVYASHYPWLIRTFWISFILGVLGLVLTVTYIGAIIGVPILIGTWVFYLYKVIKGGLRVLEGQPIS